MHHLDERPLRIVHVLRAPLGGLFRHVLDIARGQVQRGHEVGLIVDQLIGGERAIEVLREIEPSLKLGLLRLPMRRNPHPSDLPAFLRVSRRLATLKPDVAHGHGAKGGLYARAPGLVGLCPNTIRAYTPHGGSLNYRPGSTANLIFMRVERALARATDLLLFESAYIAERYNAAVGPTDALRRIVVNGISPAEFRPVHPTKNAADLFYMGELRSAKGIDTLLDAMPLVAQKIGRTPSLVLVGSGPDHDILAARAKNLGCADHVRFVGAMPAHQAFGLGQILVVPSRAESLPYVILEAAGARVPIITTDVGGIPEIFGPYADRLIQSDNAPLLAKAIIALMNKTAQERQQDAENLVSYVGQIFTIDQTVEGGLAGYREAIARKQAFQAARDLPVHKPVER